MLVIEKYQWFLFHEPEPDLQHILFMLINMMINKNDRSDRNLGRRWEALTRAPTLTRSSWIPIIHSNRQVREYKFWRAWGTPRCCLHTNFPPQPPAHTHILHIYSYGLRQDKEIDTLELLFNAGQSRHREAQSSVFVTVLFSLSVWTHH